MWQRRGFSATTSSSSGTRAAGSALWTEHPVDGSGKTEVFSLPPDDDYVTILRNTPPPPPPHHHQPSSSTLPPSASSPGQRTSLNATIARSYGTPTSPFGGGSGGLDGSVRSGGSGVGGNFPSPSRLGATLPRSLGTTESPYGTLATASSIVQPQYGTLGSPYAASRADTSDTYGVIFGGGRTTMGNLGDSLAAANAATAANTSAPATAAGRSPLVKEDLARNWSPSRENTMERRAHG